MLQYFILCNFDFSKFVIKFSVISKYEIHTLKPLSLSLFLHILTKSAYLGKVTNATGVKAVMPEHVSNSNNISSKNNADDLVEAEEGEEAEEESCSEVSVCNVL